MVFGGELTGLVLCETEAASIEEPKAALRPWADDRELLTAVNRGDFLLNGLRNRDPQNPLCGAEASTPAERKKRSAAISRKLRLLRAHGLIRKVPRTHRYQVIDSGRIILVAVLTTAQTSASQINRLAKAARKSSRRTKKQRFSIHRRV